MWNDITQFLNRWFYRGAVLFFPPEGKLLPADPRSILIFSSTGIGDALVDSAAIESLHRAYPAAKIIVCTHHRRMSVVSHHPHVDEIIPLSKSPLSQLQLLKYFWKQRPDIVIGLHLNAEAVPLGYLLNRCAFVGSQEECREMAFLLSHPVVTQDERHMVKIALKVAERAGGVAVEGMIYQVKPEEVIALRQRFPEWTAKPYLVMQTGGGKTLNWRDWPVEGYTETIRWVEAHYPHRVILTGGHDNREAGQAIAAACPNVINLVEKTTLEETAALLDDATLLVSTDTGVMHLGLAIGCPTLSLLHYRNPAAACGPLDFSPGHEVVELPRPAVVPANHEKEMGNIPMDAVKAALVRMLG
ncbi:MAG: glycosyltransferase family 9 protein [Chthoniobacterales bacterium]|nr:glycosyltransferase family 9 protein [Chthoniobacterales bacterium]